MDPDSFFGLQSTLFFENLYIKNSGYFGVGEVRGEHFFLEKLGVLKILEKLEVDIFIILEKLEVDI